MTRALRIALLLIAGLGGLESCDSDGRVAVTIELERGHGYVLVPEAAVLRIESAVPLRLPYAVTAHAVTDAGTTAVPLTWIDELTAQGDLAAYADAPAEIAITLPTGVDPASVATVVSGRRLPNPAPLARPLPAADARPLNVLVYVIDTLRADHLSLYGYHRDTSPFLASLADEAVVFDRAFAPASFTAATMSALFTGRYPSEVIWRHQAGGIAEGVLAEVFRGHGYRTAAFQSNLLLRKPYDRGFDDYELLVGPKHRGRDTTVGARTLHREAVDWLIEHRRDPFFMLVQSMDVHYPYKSIPVFRDRYVAPGQHRRITRSARRKRRLVDAMRISPDRYDAAIAYADNELRSFYRGLGRMGLLDHSIIVITADHGEPLYEHGKVHHGSALFEEQIHVPLIIRLPSAQARRVSEPVSLLDLGPTVLDLVGLPPIPGAVGRSWLGPAWAQAPPVVLGELVSFVHLTRRGWYVRDHRWKAIGKDRSVRLYDLETDPDEARDVSATFPVRAAYMASIAERSLPAGPATTGSGVPASALTPAQERQRERDLRALGYIE